MSRAGDVGGRLAVSQVRDRDRGLLALVAAGGRPVEDGVADAECSHFAVVDDLNETA